MLYFKLYPFTLLMQSRSFTFLFMYLGELLQYYHSSNNLPQNAQTFDFDLKSCFGLLRTLSRSAHCILVSVWIFHALCCWRPWVTLLILDLSVSIFAALVCSTPQVALLVVDLSLDWSLVSFYPLCRSNFLLLMFHSLALLSIRPFSHSFEFGLCLAAYCTFVIPSQYQTFACHCGLVCLVCGAVSGYHCFWPYDAGPSKQNQ